MSVVSSGEEKCCRIQFDGVIDISCAEEVKSALTEALEAGKAISISLAGATDLDVTAVQLLWAAGREAGQRGLEFDVTGLPEPVSRLLQEADLNRFHAHRSDGDRDCVPA